MSGGVDSSVAALLLQRAGHEVVGVFMRNGVAGPGTRVRSCCSASDARDAALVADALGIAFYSVDYEVEFAALMDRFAAEYRAGRTPNPCVWCNQELKFGHLFRLADEIGAAAVATGHYARLAGGALCTARDADKDQTYFLYGIDRPALPRVLFPLGDLTKAEVRALAAAAGLRTAGKAESMEICFVTTADYRDVVRARGGAGRPGRFVAADGRELGRHEGVGDFTIGQRRGLPALGTPHYVKAIDPVSGDVLLVGSEQIGSAAATAADVRWLIPDPATGTRLRVATKVRARHRAMSSTAHVLDDALVRVEFDEPVAAVAPGQAAVFYDGDRVLGGGTLLRAD
jgi:tRNA-specific 2-thiouridylase